MRGVKLILGAIAWIATLFCPALAQGFEQYNEVVQGEKPKVHCFSSGDCVAAFLDSNGRIATAYSAQGGLNFAATQIHDASASGSPELNCFESGAQGICVMAWTANNGSKILSMRSTDRGITWADATSVISLGTKSEPSLSCFEPSQQSANLTSSFICMLTIFAKQNNADVLLRMRSTDGATSWNGINVLSVQSVLRKNRSAVGCSPQGQLCVTAWDGKNGQDSQVQLQYSRDQGSSWTGPQFIDFSSRANGLRANGNAVQLDELSVACSSSQSCTVVYQVGVGNSISWTERIETKDGGISFNSIQPFQKDFVSAGSSPEQCCDPTGYCMVIWQDTSPNGEEGLRYAVRDTTKKDWSDSELITVLDRKTKRFRHPTITCFTGACVAMFEVLTLDSGEARIARLHRMKVGGSSVTSKPSASPTVRSGGNYDEPVPSNHPTRLGHVEENSAGGLGFGPLVAIIGGASFLCGFAALLVRRRSSRQEQSLQVPEDPEDPHERFTIRTSGRNSDAVLFHFTWPRMSQLTIPSVRASKQIMIDL